MTNWYQERGYERPMEEGTRMKTLKEAVCRSDSQLQQVHQSTVMNQESIAVANRRQEGILKTIDEIKESMDSFQQEVRNLLDQQYERMRNMIREVEDRTLYIKIHFEIYSISCEFLGQMFSEMGVVESVDRFNEGDQFHSRVCFRNRDSAIEALNWFYGRCIYDGCCQMELFLGSALRSHSSSNLGEGVVEEIAAPNQRVSEDSVELPQSSDETKNEILIDVCQEKNSPPEILEAGTIDRAGERDVPSNQESTNFGVNSASLGANSADLGANATNLGTAATNFSFYPEQMDDGYKQEYMEDHEQQLDALSIEEWSEETDSISVDQSLFEFSKVNSYLPIIVVDELAGKDLDELVDNSNAMAEFRMFPMVFVVIPTSHRESVEMSGQSRAVSSKIVKFLESNPAAHKVFEKMPKKKTMLDMSYVLILVFDPGGVLALALIEETKSEIAISEWSQYLAVFDPEIADICVKITSAKFKCCYLDVVDDIQVSLPYDKGKVMPWHYDWDEEISYWIVTFESCGVLIFIFYPGSVFVLIRIDVAKKRLKWDPGGGCLFKENLYHHFLVLVSIGRRQGLLKTPTTAVLHTSEVLQKVVKSSHSELHLEGLVLVQNELNNASSVEMEKENGLIFVYDPGISKWVFGRLVVISMLKSNAFLELRDYWGWIFSSTGAAGVLVATFQRWYSWNFVDEHYLLNFVDAQKDV